jgi:hypothetical protein
MSTQIGLWIDHRKAVIVTLAEAGEEIRTIVSGMEKRVRFKSGRNDELGSTEDIRERQFGQHLNRYYDEVIAAVREADSIHIFGPGEAKLELENRLERAGLKNCVATVETADKMTDRQIAARVRELLRS